MTEVAYRNGFEAGKQAALNELPEMQYYIIKNADTGLYFRGKGVNRWGKYLNQASVYRIKGQAEGSAREINAYKKPDEHAIVIPIKIIELDSEI
jgi:hypothetical protein